MVEAGRRDRQDRRDGRPLLPPGLRARASRPTRSSPSPSPTRRPPSCASGSGPSSSARAEQGSERARELLPGLGGAWITTIHGFCNRLLSAHPVAVGIDPRFRVLDAPEAERAAREAFDEALEAFLAGGRAPTARTTVAAYDIDGLRGMVDRRPRGAAQPRRGRAASCPSRRRPTSPRRCGARPRAAARDARRS